MHVGLIEIHKATRPTTVVNKALNQGSSTSAATPTHMAKKCPNTQYVEINVSKQY